MRCGRLACLCRYFLMAFKLCGGGGRRMMMMMDRVMIDRLIEGGGSR